MALSVQEVYESVEDRSCIGNAAILKCAIFLLQNTTKAWNNCFYFIDVFFL